MSVPTPLMLFDQIVSRSFDPCWFWRNGSPADLLGVSYTVCCLRLCVLVSLLLRWFGCGDRVGEAFVVVVDVFVVRDCWVLRESGIPVTPGGCGTGKRRFPGMRVDGGECRGGWVLSDAGNSGMWMQWKWGNGGEMMEWMHSMLWKN
eukprot:scaffold2123_cov96-Cylindrotheca_fusiformis.AAC.13